MNLLDILEEFLLESVVENLVLDNLFEILCESFQGSWRLFKDPE